MKNGHSARDTNQASKLSGRARFPEGRKIAVLRVLRERNAALVKQAKERFLATHGSLHCEVCDFDFSRGHGERGNGFIEAHHSVPLKDLPEVAETRIEDLRMVCANCHRMLHRGERWLTVDELRAIIAATDNQ
ncbi:MAG TPA: HNH endonuclease [Chthonomonadaceae bacterium]|nr:HNH endonuclease [Chthonomonadaceae bacterium]